MKSPIIDLKDVPAIVQSRHLDDFENLWRGMLLELNEDAFWSWAMKKRLSNNDARFEAYAIEYEGLTQGLMWLETQWHRILSMDSFTLKLLPLPPGIDKI